MANEYSCKVVKVTADLSPLERVRLKDTTDAFPIDTLVADGPVEIEYAYHAELAVHNDRAEDKDYTKIIIVDAAGTKYTTGSASFQRALEEITEDLREVGYDGPIRLKLYSRESKNYKGKGFLTCSLA